ncbi:MAG: zinc ribbon domain-containing protein [Oscillospiraceae bacterium]|nr:zinc ribbon domain-containing protein [Oscillospiraceae bacterium]
MPYCQNCGTEVAGNFCPNCGAQTGTVTPPLPQLIIHENAVVKPRYTTGALLLAGWLGLGLLIGTLTFFIYGVLIAPGSFGDKLGMLIACLITGFLTYLCYLPGIRSIRKTAPKGEFFSTFKSFFLKSLIFIFAWGVTIAGCVYIIGIFFKVWRFGQWASRPNDDQYTAFVDGEKIPVTRYYDDLPDYGARGDWVYRADNGEFYRPPVK